MRSLLPVTLAACLLYPDFSAAATDGALLERRPYLPPRYEAVPELAKLFPAAEYEAALADRRYAFERLTYSSDGLPVVAYLYRPATAPARPLPVVVFNRGGYVRGDVGGELLPILHRLGEAGFVVLAPLYRGSDGAPGHDEMGGADLRDLMNIVPLAAALGIADTTRMHLYGESRGGVMVLAALREGFHARSAAVYGAFTDLDSLIAADRKTYDAVLPKVWPDFAAQHEQIEYSRSAARWAEQLTVPMLIMHGGADGNPAPTHALRLAERLQALGREYELVIYGGDRHVLSANHLDRDARAVRWFVRHQAAAGEAGSGR